MNDNDDEFDEPLDNDDKFDTTLDDEALDATLYDAPPEVAPELAVGLRPLRPADVSRTSVDQTSDEHFFAVPSSAMLSDAIEEYWRKCARGVDPDPEQFVNEHPHLAPQLWAYFSSSEWIERMERQSSDGSDSDVSQPDSNPARCTPNRARVNATRTPLSQPRPSYSSPHGMRIVGGYELLHEISRTGNASVYVARERTLNRLVAITVVLSGPLATTEEVQRFCTEAQTAANVDHPGLVPTFEVAMHVGQPQELRNIVVKLFGEAAHE